MKVSWNWLREYFPDLPPAHELAERLAMAGLNHESIDRVGDDVVLDLEVTSNRGDCMSHIGVAREVAALYDRPLRLPPAEPHASGPPISDHTSVTVECPDLCPQYAARLIRGVTIRPSPEWLVRRLASLAIKPINNVVDITNYVLFECGQPLHAFDFTKLRGQRIVVRSAREGEQLVAIDHRTYPLAPGMCVIADAERPVAIGGIMGGWETEVTDGTQDVLIEAAEFCPVSIRTTSRKLGLRSPSSERFERGIDPEGVDWASRRCCELILELAGGTLCEGSIHVGRQQAQRERICLRVDQLRRILGIDVPVSDVLRILGNLGFHHEFSFSSTPPQFFDDSFAADYQGPVSRSAVESAIEKKQKSEKLWFVRPSWRRDVTREIDLVEEVARIWGYDKIPEDVRVPLAPAPRVDADRVMAVVRGVLTAAGFDEALTVSAVPEDWSACFSPWTDQPALRCQTPVVKGADVLRRSLVPSLLACRAYNESVGNDVIELFETARVYLARANQLPEEPLLVALTSQRDFFSVKGVLEALLEALHIRIAWRVKDYKHPFFRPGEGVELEWDGQRWAVLGTTSAQINKLFGLRRPTVVAEFRFDTLLRHAVLVPKYVPVVPYPAVQQDLNFVVDESLRWEPMETVIRQAGGPLLESVRYRETYRDPKTDGQGKKRILLRITLRSTEGTLTIEQANAVRDQIVRQVTEQCGARLLGTGN
jgi:phenylalanyl-tRNA synthetase beta chain